MPLICYVPKSFRADTQTRIIQANKIIAEYQAQGFKLTLRQLYYQFVKRPTFTCIIADTRRPSGPTTSVEPKMAKAR